MRLPLPAAVLGGKAQMRVGPQHAEDPRAGYLEAIRTLDRVGLVQQRLDGVGDGLAVVDGHAVRLVEGDERGL